MPTCHKSPTVALHSDFCGRTYEAAYCWRKGPECCAVCFLKVFSRTCAEDQVYEGELFRNALHGQGTYKWGDSAVFEGGFYSNRKEGYAIVSYHDNCHFEGLFIGNKPFGPGIFTYANGRQDAGFWVGRKLVRLSRAADYIIPRLAPTSAAKIKLLQFRRLIPLDELRGSANDILERLGCSSENCPSPYSTLIHDPRSFFFEQEIFEKTYFVSTGSGAKEFDSPKGSRQEEEEESGSEREEREIPAHCLCSQDVLEMNYVSHNEVDICEGDNSTDSQTGILYNLTKYGVMERPVKSSEEEGADAEVALEGLEREDGEAEEGSNSPKIVSWNRSELCTEMLKQIFRYRAFEEKLNFNLAKLMLGARTAFRRTGVREKECLHFLKMCSLGPVHVVKDLLCSYGISEELMDARGNNSLMFAAATDQLDIIDALLDYGVDVNTFNDEGLTPLNLCLLRRLAQANKISNWEAAFLPKETDQSLVPEGYTQNAPWERWESIPSLDRVFGDGMSMNDSKTLIVDSRFFSPITSPSPPKEDRGPDESKDNSSRSQVTVLNVLKSPMTCPVRSAENVFQPPSSTRSPPLATCEPTPRADATVVPKSNKRDEFEKSIAKTSDSDKYLFEFSFEKPPVVAASGKKRSDSAKSTATKGKGKKEEPVKEEVVEVAPDLELIAKIQEIDRTIEKLLKRGADPNVSEVPKPSIHLGLYTKDVAVVRLLLMYGASPNTQLYANEGLLTPLHVLVLLKSAPEFVRICELLLGFGANVEEETRPEFSICEEEKSFLSGDEGRTPLQLLCMRPDVEHADPDDNLIKIALSLAKVSDKRHFYNGHSCLTLAMHLANFKLLKALLSSKDFDPNDLLGKDLGTALHVLVSTDFQKKTIYDTSIKICDILLGAGADPTKELKSPEKLLGTCVDYGYREIEAEKDARKGAATGKKGDKSGKEKSEASREKTGKEKGGRDHLKDHIRVVEYLKEVVRKIKSGEEGAESKSKANERGKGVKKSSEDSRRVTLSKASERGGDSETKEKSKANEENKQKKESADVSINFKRHEDMKEGERKASQEKQKKTEDENKKGEKKTTQKGEDNEKGIKRTRQKEGDEGREKKRKDKGEREEREKHSKEEDKGNRNQDKTIGKTESSLLRDKRKTSSKSLSHKARSETFPEKIRQKLLRMFGACSNIDVNELLLPYVVLRDGELYYRFQGRGTSQKEQYSLI